MKQIKRYHDLHWVEKMVDGMLLLSVLTALVLISIELFFSPTAETLQTIYRLDAVLLGVFFIDSARTFYKSRSLPHYLKHHWLDLILLVVVILSLSSVFFTGIGRMRWLAEEEQIFTGLGKYVSLSFMRRVK